jgi:hypothetical protein
VFEDLRGRRLLGDGGQQAQAASAVMAAEGVDRERSPEELGPLEARRGREHQATEEPVKVAHGDAELRDDDVALGNVCLVTASGRARSCVS